MGFKPRSGSPLVMNVKGNSLDDGPGVRSVIFLKGCPLDCLWCQNPESKSAKNQLFYDKSKCVGCMECVRACPEKVFSKDIPVQLNRGRCALHFHCADVCPSKALSRAGREYGVDELVAKVVPYKPFFTRSGGGVTVSGGEPTLFMDYLSSLLRQLKTEGIHTLVETSGLFDVERFETKILPYVDMIYMDMKIIDMAEHKRFCGVPNDVIQQNFLRLHQLAKTSAFTITPRTPLIPGMTDSDDKMQALADFYHAHGVMSAALLKNNPVWLDKVDTLGLDLGFASDSPLRRFYDNEEFDRIVEMFREKGIDVHE